MILNRIDLGTQCTIRETGEKGIIKNGIIDDPKDCKITVVIPVAGMGHRMKSYGPKCLLPANKKETITIDKDEEPFKVKFDKIKSLPIWKKEIIIEKLDGGLTNHNFIVVDSSDKFVVRIGLNSSDSFAL